jgi:hypothetical protein
MSHEDVSHALGQIGRSQLAVRVVTGYMSTLRVQRVAQICIQESDALCPLAVYGLEFDVTVTESALVFP